MAKVTLKNKYFFRDKIYCDFSWSGHDDYKFEYSFNELKVIKNAETVIRVDYENINYIKDHNVYIYKFSTDVKQEEFERFKGFDKGTIFINTGSESPPFPWGKDIWDIYYIGYKFEIKKFWYPLLTSWTFPLNMVEISYDDILLSDESSDIDELLIIGILSFAWLYFYRESDARYSG